MTDIKLTEDEWRGLLETLKRDAALQEQKLAETRTTIRRIECALNGQEGNPRSQQNRRAVESS